MYVALNFEVLCLPAAWHAEQASKALCVSAPVVCFGGQVVSCGHSSPALWFVGPVNAGREML
jgi:hypothetical protein